MIDSISKVNLVMWPSTEQIIDSNRDNINTTENSNRASKENMDNNTTKDRKMQTMETAQVMLDDSKDNMNATRNDK